MFFFVFFNSLVILNVLTSIITSTLIAHIFICKYRLFNLYSIEQNKNLLSNKVRLKTKYSCSVYRFFRFLENFRGCIVLSFFLLCAGEGTFLLVKIAQSRIVKIKFLNERWENIDRHKNKKMFCFNAIYFIIQIDIKH